MRKYFNITKDGKVVPSFEILVDKGITPEDVPGNPGNVAIRESVSSGSIQPSTKDYTEGFLSEVITAQERFPSTGVSTIPMSALSVFESMLGHSLNGKIPISETEEFKQLQQKVSYTSADLETMLLQNWNAIPKDLATAIIEF